MLPFGQHHRRWAHIKLTPRVCWAAIKDITYRGQRLNIYQVSAATNSYIRHFKSKSELNKLAFDLSHCTIVFLQLE